MKRWLAGEADEVWKVMICARDANHADDLIKSLVYILTDAGSDVTAGSAEIRSMSGAQIIDGLLAYKATAFDSVAKALTAGTRSSAPA